MKQNQPLTCSDEPRPTSYSQISSATATFTSGSHQVWPCLHAFCGVLNTQYMCSRVGRSASVTTGTSGSCIVGEALPPHTAHSHTTRGQQPPPPSSTPAFPVGGRAQHLTPLSAAPQVSPSVLGATSSSCCCLFSDPLHLKEKRSYS